ncbi:MAG: hypothetical protein ACP5TL_02580 [Candidatus Micrarchaeia archaeon]
MIIIFAILAALEIVSILLIFIFKNVLHSIIMLSIAFITSSLIFFFMQQPLLGLLQLFIVVGGIITYLFISVASISMSKFRHTTLIAFMALSVILATLLSYSVLGVSVQSGSNILTKGLIVSYIDQSIAAFYIIAITLFGASIGAIALFKSLGVK